MNIEALMIVGSIIFITIALTFTINIVKLEDKIDKLKSELDRLKNDFEEHKK